MVLSMSSVTQIFLIVMWLVKKEKKYLYEVQPKDNFSSELLFLYILTNNWNVIIDKFISFSKKKKKKQIINKFILWTKAGQITSMPKYKGGQAIWQPHNNVPSNLLHIKQKSRDTIHITINFEVQKELFIFTLNNLLNIFTKWPYQY